ncbi:MAG: site-specific DNA-methyltransferase [Betaproteobacteria bacterium]|nr:site-specific DNA-methyltransferase [Betaproteobacteria bacterium]
MANQAKRKLGPTRESPIGRVWSGMMARCFNSKHRSYPAYGGRGISVVLAWRTLEGFAAGMGERPAGAQIDRIDNSKGYDPGNCRWVTTRQQNHNRTNVTLIEIDGITESAPWWAEKCGLSAVCILDRYTRGLRGQALLQPAAAYQTRHNAKLSSSQVEDIRRAYAGGGTTLKGLAIAYGVSKSATYLIVKGKTYRGSAYRVEGVRVIASGPGWSLILGDCLCPTTGLASLADKSVDHVITDPPYESEAHTLQRRIFNGGEDRGGGIKSAPLDFGAIDKDTRGAVAVEIARVGRRWAVVFCQAEAVSLWRDALAAGGAKWRRACVWVKPNGQPQMTGDRPGMGYESMACAWCSDGRSSWNAGGKHGVYTHAVDANFSRVVREHPTQKPRPLMEALVRDFTDPGELVCDPFAGSGTTGVACIRLGRRFVGWERDPKYHAIAVKRLSQAREQLRMFDGDGLVEAQRAGGEG